MRRSSCIAIVCLAACGGDGDNGTMMALDGSTPDASGFCNPLTQTGCAAAQKCTWIVDALMPAYVGHVGCAPDGSANVGDACEFGAPGASGHDNCKKGSVCSNYLGGTGTCKQICDHQGGFPMCNAQYACVPYSGLFDTETTPNVAGVCDRSCDPLADNDFDGSGAKTRTGTSCGTSLGVGCYGYPSFGVALQTGWSCTDDVNATVGQPTGLRHRVQCTELTMCAAPGPTVYVNSCNQGYLPLLRESSMISTTICVAMCKPKNCYTANCGANGIDRLGEAPHRCNVTDRLGTFDNGPAAEHCRFSWWFERDSQGNFLRSPTSDTVGFCVDHSKYRYDADGNGMAESPLPACSTLPDGFGVGSALGAADLGCVDTTHAQLAHGKAVATHPFDDLRPLMRRMKIAK